MTDSCPDPRPPERAHRQCKLMQNTPMYSTSRITYLPELALDGTPLAVEGGRVQLRDRGEWSEPWTIAWVSTHPLSGREVPTVRDRDIRAAGNRGPAAESMTAQMVVVAAQFRTL